MSKGKKEEDVLIIQKYTTSQKGTILMVISLGISFAIYIAILYILNACELGNEIIVRLSVFRDVLLAVISIIGTSLLTSIFIEHHFTSFYTKK